MIKELDTVVLTKDLPKHGLKKGDIGAVVHSYKEHKSFEIEFITGHGGTVAVVTLKVEDVRLMQGKFCTSGNYWRHHIKGASEPFLGPFFLF